MERGRKFEIGNRIEIAEASVRVSRKRLEKTQILNQDKLFGIINIKLQSTPTSRFIFVVPEPRLVDWGYYGHVSIDCTDPCNVVGT